MPYIARNTDTIIGKVHTLLVGITSTSYSIRVHSFSYEFGRQQAPTYVFAQLTMTTSRVKKFSTTVRKYVPMRTKPSACYRFHFLSFSSCFFPTSSLPRRKKILYVRTNINRVDNPPPKIHDNDSYLSLCRYD